MQMTLIFQLGLMLFLKPGLVGRSNLGYWLASFQWIYRLPIFHLSNCNCPNMEFFFSKIFSYEILLRQYLLRVEG